MMISETCLEQVGLIERFYSCLYNVPISAKSGLLNNSSRKRDVRTTDRRAGSGPRVGFGLTRLGFGRMLKKGCERYSGERDDDIRNMFRTSWFDRKILFLPIGLGSREAATFPSFLGLACP